MEKVGVVERSTVLGCTASCHLAQGNRKAGWLLISRFLLRCQVAAAQTDSTDPTVFEPGTGWQLTRDSDNQPSLQLGDHC